MVHTPYINAIRRRIGRGLPIGLAEQEAWRELGVLVVRMADPRLGDDEKLILGVIGDRLHGAPDTSLWQDGALPGEGTNGACNRPVKASESRKGCGDE